MSNRQTTMHCKIAKMAKGAVLGLVLAGLTGCSGFEGVEFQGKLFNAVGLGSKQRAAEPKVAQRNGLVVPPAGLPLPAPGSGRVAVAGGPSWPKDPETVQRAAAARQAAAIQKYCTEESWWKRANPNEFDKMTKNGELCQSGISKTITKNVAQ